jgi:hypothetical protein
MYQLNSLVMEEFTILLKWWHKCKVPPSSHVILAIVPSCKHVVTVESVLSSEF